MSTAPAPLSAATAGAKSAGGRRCRAASPPTLPALSRSALAIDRVRPRSTPTIASRATSALRCTRMKLAASSFSSDTSDASIRYSRSRVRKVTYFSSAFRYSTSATGTSRMRPRSCTEKCWRAGSGASAANASARASSRSAPQRLRQTRRPHRLQQVVQCVHVEGLQRMLLERGDENHRRRAVGILRPAARQLPGRSCRASARPAARCPAAAAAICSSAACALPASPTSTCGHSAAISASSVVSRRARRRLVVDDEDARDHAAALARCGIRKPQPHLEESARDGGGQLRLDVVQQRQPFADVVQRHLVAADAARLRRCTRIDDRRFRYGRSGGVICTRICAGPRCRLDAVMHGVFQQRLQQQAGICARRNISLLTLTVSHCTCSRSPRRIFSIDRYCRHRRISSSSVVMSRASRISTRNRSARSSSALFGAARLACGSATAPRSGC